MAGNAIRVSNELIDELREEATAMTRSLTGQAEHWMRLGRAIERSPAFNYDRIRSALNAEVSPDDLNAEEGQIYSALLMDTMWDDADASSAEDYSQMAYEMACVGVDITALGDPNPAANR